jgi:hypothetical protein
VALGLLFLVVWTVVWLSSWVLGGPQSAWLLPAALVGTLLLGGFVAGGHMGVYLFLANRLFGWHNNEVFSCQSIPDYRSFLRLRVDGRKLTIFPLGIEAVPRQWRHRRPDDFRTAEREQGMDEGKTKTAPPVLEPTEGPIRVHLIEGPIEIDSVL